MKTRASTYFWYGFWIPLVATSITGCAEPPVCDPSASNCLALDIDTMAQTSALWIQLRDGNMKVLARYKTPPQNGRFFVRLQVEKDYQFQPQDVRCLEVKTDENPPRVARQKLQWQGASTAPVSVNLHALPPINFSAINVPTRGNDSRSMVAADLNGDGVAELITANSQSANLSVLQFSPSSSTYQIVFSPTTVQPYSVSVGDFDHDGYIDVATANLSSATNSFYVSGGQLRWDL